MSSQPPRVDWWTLEWIALQDGVRNVTHYVGAMSAALQADPSHSPQKKLCRKKGGPTQKHRFEANARKSKLCLVIAVFTYS